MIKDEYSQNLYLKYKNLKKEDIEKAVSDLFYGNQQDKPLRIIFLNKEAEELFKQQLLNKHLNGEL